jgi:hypothetical protein
VPQERRFAYLPGPGDQQHRELFRRCKEERFEGPGNIHVNTQLSSNMHSDCNIADQPSVVKAVDQPHSLNSPPEVSLSPRFEFVDLMALLDLSKEFLVQGGTCFPIILPGPELLKVETLLAFSFLTEKFSQKLLAPSRSHPGDTRPRTGNPAWQPTGGTERRPFRPRSGTPPHHLESWLP